MWENDQSPPLKDPGKMPQCKSSLLTAVISPQIRVFVTATGAIILCFFFACLRWRECLHMWTSLIGTCSKMLCRSFTTLPSPSPHLWWPLVRPRSANQTGENELKSSLVTKRCGCLEQVHESWPRRHPADFKYKHL